VDDTPTEARTESTKAVVETALKPMAAIAPIVPSTCGKMIREMAPIRRSIRLERISGWLADTSKWRGAGVSPRQDETSSWYSVVRYVHTAVAAFAGMRLDYLVMGGRIFRHP
jgi:hypothetical protein